MMYSAHIEMGWVDDWFDGETAMDIMHKVEGYQDFNCLLSMASGEVDKLYTLVAKMQSDSLTLEDLKNLDIKLSIGIIKCHEVKEI